MRYTFRGIELPYHLKETIDAYVATGRPTGSFIGACLENNLSNAIGYADEISMAALPTVVSYLYNECPSDCWGSVLKVQEWLKEKAAELGVSQ